MDWLDDFDQKVPLAIDVMCGKNMPVGKALEACGWAVVGFDSEPPFCTKLMDPAWVGTALQTIQQAVAVMIAMDCSTLSRARERPIPGWKNPPQPLRDHQHVLGKALGGRDAERVHDANQLVALTTGYATAADDRGAAAVLENPRNSWY